MRLSLLGLLALAACATQPAAVVCPRLVEYPASVQREAAAALDAAPPVIVRMIEDYGRLRAEVRALCP